MLPEDMEGVDGYVSIEELNERMLEDWIVVISPSLHLSISIQFRAQMCLTLNHLNWKYHSSFVSDASCCTMTCDSGRCVR
jgi:hypothetical protein